VCIQFSKTRNQALITRVSTCSTPAVDGAGAAQTHALNFAVDEIAAALGAAEHHAALKGLAHLALATSEDAASQALPRMPVNHETRAQNACR